MSKFCQSCGMPLAKYNQGREKDGSKSAEYCSFCYLHGEYTNPNLTYEEMLKIGLDSLDKSDTNRLMRGIYKKSYPLILKGTKRWKK